MNNIIIDNEKYKIWRWLISIDYSVLGVLTFLYIYIRLLRFSRVTTQRIKVMLQSPRDLSGQYCLMYIGSPVNWKHTTSWYMEILLLSTLYLKWQKLIGLPVCDYRAPEHLFTWLNTWIKWVIIPYWLIMFFHLDMLKFITLKTKTIKVI